MSKSICKAYKANKNDEMYTPRILVECLKPYFENWCTTKRKNPSQIKVWARHRRRLECFQKYCFEPPRIGKKGTTF